MTDSPNAEPGASGQQMLEAKIDLVAVNGDTDIHWPEEVVRTDRGFETIRYEMDDDDEYFTGERTVIGDGPIGAQVRDLLQTVHRVDRVESISFSGLTFEEVVELVSYEPYRTAVLEVLPPAASVADGAVSGVRVQGVVVARRGDNIDPLGH